MQQLDPGAVIGKALTTYRDNAVVLFPIALGVVAIQVLVAAVLVGDTIGELVAFMLALILSYVLQGMFVEVARDVEDGVLDSTPGQLVAAALPAVVPLFLVGVLAGVATLLGLLLVVVPGLFVMTIFAVVAPVTVLERPGVFAALRRSRELVAGSGWQVFALVLFNLLLNIIASRIALTVGGGVVGDLINWFVAAAFAPLTALIIATAYLRLREAHGEPPLPTGIATADGPLARPGDEIDEHPPKPTGLGGF